MLGLSINLDGGVSWTFDWPEIRKEQMRAGILSLRRHFLTLGGTTFWPGAATSTEGEISGDDVLLLVYQKGVLLRWKGTEGYPPVVSPTGQLMAIPEDEGNREYPRHYKGTLKFIPIKNKEKLKGILVDAKERRSKRKIKGQYKMVIAAEDNAPVRYWLVDHTEHEADPNVIDMEQLTSDIGKATRLAVILGNKTGKKLL